MRETNQTPTHPCRYCQRPIRWGARTQAGEPIVERTKQPGCYDCERAKRGARKEVKR